MTAERVTLAELRAMLEDRALSVAQEYAPPAQGSYLHAGEWWTLNPGRADRRVGSFVVRVAGARRGTWNDYATGQHGDLIDLIALRHNMTIKDAMQEARRWLGLAEDTPEARQSRARALAEAERRRAAAEAEDARRRAHRARQALGLWLDAQAQIKGTPVDHYLRGRSIDLARLGRQPRALRYAPAHGYYHMDPATGEVIEGKWPAMLALVHGPDGAPVALHRTWLAEGPQGWTKAPVPVPKKVLGHYGGGAIHIWKGIGPRGGKPARLAECPPGTQVFIGEGIEDALSLVMLAPEVRVLAAISLSNLGAVALPANVATVTLVADQDESPAARKALERAIAAHGAAGREVRLWQNRHGGKDLNDALREAIARQKAKEK
ncbi:MAG: toprim domain-containing protein [Pararhodobacter sp.]